MLVSRNPLFTDIARSRGPNVYLREMARRPLILWLIKKAGENVKVYFLYDEIGSLDMPESYRQELRDAGVEVRAFHTQKGRGNRFQLNFRNHRKIVVVDGL